MILFPDTNTMATKDERPTSPPSPVSNNAGLSNNNDYDYYRFTWADINGIARSKTVPRGYVTTAVEKGIGVYAGILAFGPKSQPVVPPEVEAIHHGNATVRPDTKTLHPLMWTGTNREAVGEYFCDTFWHNGRPQLACPRYLAQKQCERLHGRGLRLLSAFEMEFTVLDGNKPAWPNRGIFSNVLTSKYGGLLYEVEKAVRTAGVGIETMQLEYAPGQCELTLAPKFGLGAADDFFLTKHVAKEIPKCHGWEVTCMSKPLVGEAGNGAHFNHSLWDLTLEEGDDNVLHAPAGPNYLSSLAHHWLAGLSQHARALTALCCPTVNCYRRLHSVWAPTNCSWGMDNRRSTFRVKSSPCPRDTYIENRLPGGSANPYIVMAATVAAGLDGIDRELAGPDPSSAPRGQDGLLPYDLAEALTELQEDEVLVKALGEQFVRWFCQSKREVDLKELPTATDRPAFSYTEEDANKERDMYAKSM